VIERTWPCGTRKLVDVLDVIRRRDFLVLVCGEVDDTSEGHMIVFGHHHQAASAAQAGDRGTIEFKAGGPKGAYWDYLGKLQLAEVAP
jgi:hypothetical protein